MPPRNKPRDIHADPQIFKATYSGVPVYEMICKGVAVMRRRSDGWLNATQILKVAGFDKPQRTRVLEREIQKGEHEKVQGGYGKYQGTWVPLDRGISLAKQYNVNALIQPIVDFTPATNSPPLAPKHITQAPASSAARPKRKTAATAAGGETGTATRSKRSIAAASSIPTVDPGLEDTKGEDEEMEGSDSRVSSPAGSEDGSMTSSPSEASSSSRTPSPIRSSPAGGSTFETRSHGEMDNDTQLDDGSFASTSTSQYGPSGTNARQPTWPSANAPSSSTHGLHRISHPHQPQQPPPPGHAPLLMTNQYPPTRPPPPSDPRRYGDIILEYFISDTNQIPSILINPPPDFDPNMAIDDDGHTALHWACAMGRVRVVKLLLTAGADIFKTNKGGQTPLMRSVMFANNYDVRKFPELYELLHRSTLNIDNFNRTVFHHIVDVAMSKGKTHAARYYMETILNRLADFPQELADIINFQDEDGETALTLAARCRSKRLVKLLIDHGADPKIANGDSKTTEDYILEDERFRYSPIMRGQGLGFQMPLATLSGAKGAYGPQLHLSGVAQRAAGKCVQDMAMMFDSLAASFDQELADKERDLNQAHALLANIQGEILESQRNVTSLKTQAAGLEEAKETLKKMEDELMGKMGKRFRFGWEKWSKDEELRERQWRSVGSKTGLDLLPPSDMNGSGPGLGSGHSISGFLPTSNPSPERKTRAAGPAAVAEDFDDLEELYKEAVRLHTAGPASLSGACNSLRLEIEGHRKKRKEMFTEFVKHSVEGGTGGRMAEYRRLIAAGCGGIPPSEVDNVISVLLETLESDENSFNLGWNLPPSANTFGSHPPPIASIPQPQASMAMDTS